MRLVQPSCSEYDSQHPVLNAVVTNNSQISVTNSNKVETIYSLWGGCGSALCLSFIPGPKVKGQPLSWAAIVFRAEENEVKVEPRDDS